MTTKHLHLQPGEHIELLTPRQTSGFLVLMLLAGALTLIGTIEVIAGMVQGCMWLLRHL